MASQKKSKSIDLRNGYIFNKKNEVPEDLMLNPNEIKMILNTLVSVGLFYKSKNTSHGNFSPENISILFYKK